MNYPFSTPVKVCALVLILFSSLWAMEPAPLPALQLTGLDGQPITTGNLPKQGNWLLIYVTPKSHFCDEMLKLMKKDQYPTLVTDAVFVVGGSVDDAKSMQAKYPDLAAATWYADPNRVAINLLKLRGVPTVIGINQQTMKWMVNGVIPDPDNFKAILNSWIEQQPKAS
jgi:hypothetical protein